MEALIDADSLVYACGFATDTEPVQNCLHLLNISIDKILADLGTNCFEIFLTGQGNFRTTVSSTYKANRVTMRKPVHYDEARQYLQDGWGAIMVEGMEADDAVAIAQHAESIIVSQDKDLLMVPGWHYNYRKPQDGVFLVTEDEAHWFFYYQMLVGDRVDNIKGLPYCTETVVNTYGLTKRALQGCGDKTARKILNHGDNIIDWHKITKYCYDEYRAETGENTMETNAHLLWMVRELDAAGNPVLWEPPV